MINSQGPQRMDSFSTDRRRKDRGYVCNIRNSTREHLPRGATGEGTLLSYLQTHFFGFFFFFKSKCCSNSSGCETPLCHHSPPLSSLPAANTAPSCDNTPPGAVTFHSSPLTSGKWRKKKLLPTPEWAHGQFVDGQ